jgi:hypothetical protein
MSLYVDLLGVGIPSAHETTSADLLVGATPSCCEIKKMMKSAESAADIEVPKWYAPFRMRTCGLGLGLLQILYADCVDGDDNHIVLTVSSEYNLQYIQQTRVKKI